jgi:hypothetical protein
MKKMRKYTSRVAAMSKASGVLMVVMKKSETGTKSRRGA